MPRTGVTEDRKAATDELKESIIGRENLEYTDYGELIKLRQDQMTRELAVALEMPLNQAATDELDLDKLDAPGDAIVRAAAVRGTMQGGARYLVIVAEEAGRTFKVAKRLEEDQARKLDEAAEKKQAEIDKARAEESAKAVEAAEKRAQAEGQSLSAARAQEEAERAAEAQKRKEAAVKEAEEAEAEAEKARKASAKATEKDAKD